MPRKRFTIDPNDKVLKDFADRITGRRRDWREFLTVCGFTEYQIDQFMRDRAENGLDEICIQHGGKMLVDPDDLEIWLLKLEEKQ